MSTEVATTIESNSPTISPRAEMDALVEQAMLAELINNDPTIKKAYK